jgi:hypothetical protein
MKPSRLVAIYTDTFKVMGYLLPAFVSNRIAARIGNTREDQ